MRSVIRSGRVVPRKAAVTVLLVLAGCAADEPSVATSGDHEPFLTLPGDVPSGIPAGDAPSAPGSPVAFADPTAEDVAGALGGTIEQAACLLDSLSERGHAGSVLLDPSAGDDVIEAIVDAVDGCYGLVEFLAPALADDYLSDDLARCVLDELGTDGVTEWARLDAGGHQAEARSMLAVAESECGAHPLAYAVPGDRASVSAGSIASSDVVEAVLTPTGRYAILSGVYLPVVTCTTTALLDDGTEVELVITSFVPGDSIATSEALVLRAAQTDLDLSGLPGHAVVSTLADDDPVESVWVLDDHAPFGVSVRETATDQSRLDVAVELAELVADGLGL